MHASFLGDIQFYSVILLHHLSVGFEEDCFKLKWRATCPSMLLCLIKSRPTKWVVEKDIDYWGKSFKKIDPKWELTLVGKSSFFLIIWHHFIFLYSFTQKKKSSIYTVKTSVRIRNLDRWIGAKYLTTKLFLCSHPFLNHK